MNKYITTWGKKFEILAILRESFQKNNKMEISTKNNIYSTHWIDVDLNGIYVNFVQDLADDVLYKHKIEIQSSIGKIEFHTHIKEISLIKGIYTIHYNFPEILLITQRRKEERLRIANFFDFACEVKNKNGYRFSFKIKDISENGCALELNGSNNVEISKGSIIRNAQLTLGQFGKLTIDLLVIEIKDSYINNSNLCVSHFSCKFVNNNKKKSLINVIIMDILLETRRLIRVGKIKKTKRI